MLAGVKVSVMGVVMLVMFMMLLDAHGPGIGHGRETNERHGQQHDG